MPESGNVDALLQNGYWPTTRSRSPDPRQRVKPNAPVSRSFNPDPRVPRYAEKPLARRFPPLPTVEDEAASLAREHDAPAPSYVAEEPRCRGDVNQEPVIQDVHEFNPERRFVIVPNASDISDESAQSDGNVRTEPDEKPLQPSGRRPEYEANTCRKYVLVENDPNEKFQAKRPPRERRRSRLEDLPAIVTDMNPNRQSKENDPRRAKSETGTDAATEDYFSPQHSGRRRQPDDLLSPDIIKHSTKGRDRAYWDFGGPASAGAPPRSRSTQVDEPQRRSQPEERRGGGAQRSGETSPTMSKRHSAVDIPRHARNQSREDYHHTRHYSEAVPLKADLKTTPPSSYSRSERGEPIIPSGRARNLRDKRSSPPYDDGRYSSEDDKRRVDPRRRRKSFVGEERDYLPTPSESKFPGGRRSKGSSPLASPRVSQSTLSERDLRDPSPSPRSATFPIDRTHKKADSRTSTEDERSERPASRGSSARSTVSAAAPLAVPIVAAASAAIAGSFNGPDPRSLPDRRRPAMPPPKAALPRSDTQTSTPSSSPPKQAWPAKLDPPRTSVGNGKPITSVRRYSEDVNKGELPDLPECPRTREEAGHDDWFTLVRNDSVNICPTCYNATFANTEFANHFTFAPLRPVDRPLSCDFGTSQWYHIAWLLTRKYDKSDLGLIHGIASVEAKSQPCPGYRPAVRTWYSMKDPKYQRPIPDFSVCYACAKTIEVLLPNLSGIFVYRDASGQPEQGICSMHHNGWARKRFYLYFDLMETVSDQAVEARRAPNVQGLADNIRQLALMPECLMSRPRIGAKWYRLRSIPDFTVCEECFDEVIWPQLESEDTTVAGKFLHKSTRLEHAACQLYSPRMRDVFARAVRKRDVDYFESKAVERIEKEREFIAKLSGINRQAMGPERADREVARLQKEWKKWE